MLDGHRGIHKLSVAFALAGMVTHTTTDNGQSILLADKTGGFFKSSLGNKPNISCGFLADGTGLSARRTISFINDIGVRNGLGKSLIDG
jgi:hypothetical protein